LIDKPKFCSPSIYYVVSSESGIGMKDVTKRYAERWSVVIKKRIFKDELTQSIINSVSNVVLGCSIDSLFYENIQRNSEEDEELDRIAESEPIPKTLDSIKNHPLYVIEKHLKKYEAIYPMHPVLGQLAQHKVYSRSNVHTLHTKDRWIREMRQVNDNESPYKTVKGKSTSELELFGKWQTHPWTPPKAIDGMVPKNDRGNVELWSDAHLPEGTVQIQLQGASTICRKLGIDYAPALVGFEIRGGRSVPVLDGIIICKEYEQSVRDACDEHNNRKNREEADRLWRLLLRGVWAHHLIMQKEQQEEEEEEEEGE
jgi:xeroderma pigmentosum group C-complementing protein